MPKGKPNPKVKAAVKSAVSNFASGNFEQVLEACESALALAPQNFNAKLLRAKALCSLGNFDKSESLFTELCENELEQAEPRIEALAGLDELYSADNDWTKTSGRFGCELHARCLTALVASLSASKNLRRLKPVAIRLAKVLSNNGNVEDAHEALSKAAVLFSNGDFSQAASLPVPKRQSIVDLLWTDLTLVGNAIFGRDSETDEQTAAIAAMSKLVPTTSPRAASLCPLAQQFGTILGSVNPAVDDLPPQSKGQFCQCLAIVAALLRVQCQLAQTGDVEARLRALLEWCQFCVNRCGSLRDEVDSVGVEAFLSLASLSFAVAQVVSVSKSKSLIGSASWITVGQQEHLANAVVAMSSQSSSSTAFTALQASRATLAFCRHSQSPCRYGEAASGTSIIQTQDPNELLAGKGTSHPIFFLECARELLRKGSRGDASRLMSTAWKTLVRCGDMFGIQLKDNCFAEVLSSVGSLTLTPATLNGTIVACFGVEVGFLRGECDIANAAHQSITQAPQQTQSGRNLKNNELKLHEVQQFFSDLHSFNPNSDSEWWHSAFWSRCRVAWSAALYEKIRVAERFPGLSSSANGGLEQAFQILEDSLDQALHPSQDSAQNNSGAVDRDNTGYLHSLSGWVLMHKRLFGEAIVKLKTSLQIMNANSPERSDAALKAVTLTRLGHAAWEEDASTPASRTDPSHSFQPWLQAIKSDASSAADAFAGLGRFYSLNINGKQPDSTRSRACYEKALQIDPLSLDSQAGVEYVTLMCPNSSLTTSELAVRTADTNKDMDKLQTVLENIVVAHSNFVEWAWHGLGKIYLARFALHSSDRFSRVCLQGSSVSATDNTASAEKFLLRSINSLQAALRINSRSWATWSSLGVAYLEHGRLTAAQKALSRSLELHPGSEFGGSAHLHERHGHVLYLLGDLDAAISSYLAALSASPAYILALVGVARCYLYRGRQYCAEGRFTVASTDFRAGARHLHSLVPSTEDSSSNPQLEHGNPIVSVAAKLYADICCAASFVSPEAFCSSTECVDAMQSNIAQTKFVERGLVLYSFVQRAIDGAAARSKSNVKSIASHESQLIEAWNCRRAMAWYDIGVLEVQVTRLRAGLSSNRPRGGPHSPKACAAFRKALALWPREPLFWNALAVAEENGPVRQHCLAHALRLVREQSQLPNASSNLQGTTSTSMGSASAQRTSDAVFWTNLAMLYLSAIPARGPFGGNYRNQDWADAIRKQSQLATEVLRISQCLNAANAVLWVGLAMAHYQTTTADQTKRQMPKEMIEYFECAIEVPPPPRTPKNAFRGLALWRLRDILSTISNEPSESRNTRLHSIVTGLAEVENWLRQALALDRHDIGTLAMLHVTSLLLGSITEATRYKQTTEGLLQQFESESESAVWRRVDIAMGACCAAGSVGGTRGGPTKTLESHAESDAATLAEMQLRRGDSMSSRATAAESLLFHPSSLHLRTVHDTAIAISYPYWWLQAVTPGSHSPSETVILEKIRAATDESAVGKLADICDGRGDFDRKTLEEVAAFVESCSDPVAQVFGLTCKAHIAAKLNAHDDEADALRSAISIASASDVASNEAIADLLPVLNARMSVCGLAKAGNGGGIKKSALEKACRSAEFALNAAGAQSTQDVQFLFCTVATVLGTSPGASKKDVARLSKVEELLQNASQWPSHRTVFARALQRHVSGAAQQ